MGFLKDVIRWIYWYPVRLSVRFIPRNLFFRVVRAGSILVSRIAVRRAREIAHVYSKASGKTLEGAELKRLVGETMANQYMNYAESPYFAHITPENVDRVITIEGIEHVDKILEQGRSVVLATFHFGAFKLVADAFGFRGYDIHGIGTPATILKGDTNPRAKSKMYRRALDLELECDRKLAGNYRYVDEPGALRKIMGCLKQGNVLFVIIADGGYGDKRRIPVHIGDVEFTITASAFDFARASNAAVVPYFVVRGDKRGNHVLHLHPPLSIPTKSEEPDYAKAIGEFQDYIRRYFDKYPSHYLHQLWLGGMMGWTHIAGDELNESS